MGFATAPARLKPAEAEPANPYDPVIASTANTSPTGYMELGNRPASPNHSRGRAPGIRITAR